MFHVTLLLPSHQDQDANAQPSQQTVGQQFPSTRLADEDTELPQRLLRAEMKIFKKVSSADSPQQLNNSACTENAEPEPTNSDNATRTTPASSAAASAPAGRSPISSTGAATTATTTPISHSSDTVTHSSRQLLLIAVPHLLSTTHLVRHLADLSLSSVESSTRVIHPVTQQHSLLLTFLTADNAHTFYHRLHNHAFHPQRREIAYVAYVAEGDVEERQLKAGEHVSFVPPPSSAYLELPACPRCLSKLDSSVTDIVAELEEYSIVKVKSKAERDENGRTKPQTWLRRKIPIWPEIQHCPTCDIINQAQNSAKPLACTYCCKEVSNVQTDTLTFPSAIPANTASHSTPTPSDPGPAALLSSPALTRSTSNVHPADNSVWLCLLCGHIGCGRYASSGAQHAFTHYCQTHHNYALELSMGSIWDYANDGYIHRVHGQTYRQVHESLLAAERKENSEDVNQTVQGPSDAELVNWNGWNEIPSANSMPPALPSISRASSLGFSVDPSANVSLSLRPDPDTTQALRVASDGGDPYSIPDYGLDVEEESALLHSKLESIATFYNELLNDTLRRQYEYFMEKGDEMQLEDERQRKELEPALAGQITDLRDEADALTTQLADLEAKNKLLDKNVREISGKVTKLSEDNAFIKDLNSNLLADQIARKKKEKEDAAKPAVAVPAVDSTAVSSASTSSSSAAASSSSSSSSSSSVASSSSSSSISVISSSTGQPVSPSPLLDLDPALVSKYAKLREEKAKKIAMLEKEVAKLMEEMEARTRKEQAEQAREEEARKERIRRSLQKNGNSSSASAASSAVSAKGSKK